MDIAFPDRRQTNLDILVEYVVVWAVCALLSGIAFRHSRILGTLLALPLLCVFGRDIACTLSNHWREFWWSRTFPRRVRPRKVAELVAAQPGRYVLHARFFRQISRGQSVPQCILEDSERKELIPVYPSSWRVIEDCRKAGLKEVNH